MVYLSCCIRLPPRRRAGRKLPHGEGANGIKGNEAGHTLRYLFALVLFLAYLTVCMGLFILYEKNSVNVHTLRTLRSNVQQQCEQFTGIIDTQFSVLESLAEVSSAQESLTDPANLAIADAIVSGGDFTRILFVEPSGTARTNDGTVAKVNHRSYFTIAIDGNRTVSDPLSSAVDDRGIVVLAVPAKSGDGTVTGVIGGVYDIDALSKFLFSGLYNGSGDPLLITSDGTLVSTTSSALLASSENFFDYCASMELLGGAAPDQVRQDFASGAGGYFFARKDTQVQYMVYQSAGLDNGWMMCYTVSGQEASADYDFIFQDVLCLGVAVLLGILLLLLFFFHHTLRERRRLLRQAQTDPLTGLHNRASTRECVNSWLATPRRQGALLMLDLDNFKEINDVWGHQAGDAILIRTAELLRNHFRQSDIIGRIGGDEFMILMKDVGAPPVVEAHMRRLCEEFRLLTDVNYPQISLSCSVGAVMVPIRSVTFEALYDYADRALYQAKHDGKNGWSFAPEEL